ncbi:MAG: hypothetical protein LUC98_06425 [Lachnospiraceae bacterium]|nr:hypothetical protein [Lachnospiraceae bacterium]
MNCHQTAHSCVTLCSDATLSTCAYSFENERYVVYGRLVELDEAVD